MTTELNTLLADASRLISQKDPIAAVAVLDTLFAADPLNLDAHNLREQNKLKGNFSDWMGVNSEISPDDDIFRFFANHPTSKNPVRDYLSDGWRTMIELQDVLDMYNLSLRRCNSFLEFACGQGRFTRHLARIFTEQQLTVSDVVPGSVDFLKRTLGVKGFYSNTDPMALVIPDKYEVIFVLSLFSHLPSSSWKAWIKVLFDALKPGGCLIFSTHGEKCAQLAGVDLHGDGYRFYPSSESSVLDGQVYGCAYTSLAYAKNQVIEALGSNAQVQTVANHFWGNQDAIIITA